MSKGLLRKRFYLGGLVCAVSALGVAACGSEDGGAQVESASVAEAVERLNQALPQARWVRENSRLSRIFGPELAVGATAQAAADAFIQRHAPALGVAAQGLRPASSSGAIPVKYDRVTQRYQYQLLKYSQYQNAFRVHDAEVGVLVKNQPDHPVVLVTSRAKSVAGFTPSLRGVTLGRAAAARQAQATLKNPQLRNAASAIARAPLTHFSDPEPVVFAGSDGNASPPRLAVSFIAEFPGDATTPPQKWQFVADLTSHTILDQRNLIVFEDVTGSVRGYATLGSSAPECADNVAQTLPYVGVGIAGGATTYSDLAGSFTLSTPDSNPVTLESRLSGHYFRVQDNLETRNSLLTSTVTPPAVADFEHNPTASDPFLRAQVNGYVQANQVRDWLLDIHPGYPTIAGQTNFLVRVNLTSGYCPGNAWYNGSSINFCAGSSGYANTSFAAVNFHEYGHHIVATGGSGQGAYGEGMADVIAVLMSDDPGLAYGFFSGQCSTPLRTADNNCQYSASSCSSCGSEVHACGQLISGAVWSIRDQLKQTHPETYLEILSDLAVNSVLLHSGTQINHEIPVDFLTLDDDDGNINNGTPHRTQICAGFEAHGLECPALSVGLEVEHEGTFEAQGDQGGPFTPESATYTVRNFGPDPISFSVTADVPWLTLTNDTGELAVGASALVTATINSLATELSLGDYSGNLQFTNTTDHQGDTSAPVTLQVGVPSPKYTWNLDDNPGWTAQGQWQHGVPAGLSGDPSAGFTGSNVYGYNLNGNYENNLPETHLTTTAIDCSNLSQVSLRFRRWLCIEPATYDHAYVRVSTDGINWTPVWSHAGSTLVDTSWQLQEFDISEIADGQSTVYVRWTMGTTDSIISYCGFNIDDVEILGVGESQSDCTSDSDCDDANFCNGAETCVAGSCVSGDNPCQDGVACSTDSCDEALDHCTHTPNHTLCDNGLYCDGTETCNVDTGCVSGAPPCENACEEGSDQCVECSSNSDCSDGLFCNGEEQCNDGVCVPAGADACDDGLPCTADSCNEGTQSCSHTASDALCDNGLYCDGAEICDISLGCSAGSAPCSGGSCDEATNSCVCVPDCTGKLCGDDGCGGSCGTCSAGQSCSSSGQCLSSCDGVPAFDPSVWYTYQTGTQVTQSGSLYECINQSWCWINPTNRDGSLGWSLVGPC